MEGEPGVRRQETRLTHQLLAEAIVTAEVTGALAEYTFHGFVAGPIQAQQLVKVILPPGHPFCQLCLLVTQPELTP